MPLSKEFYLEEIKSKYPNSYNESLKDLEVKELEDMLDFLDKALDKADGGSIGIEVLFKEKMKDGGRAGFFMGGPALEGQALSIYNSMNAYGFSDQEIADALSARGLYTAPGSGAGTETTTPNIIGSEINQGGGGGGGIMELQETFSSLPGDPKNFRMSQLEGTSDFFPATTMLGKVKQGISNFFQPRVKGTLGTRLANQPRLPLPASIASYSLSPFNPNSKNFNPNIIGELNFLEGQTGLIGRDPNTGGLKYGPESVLAGKNVISMFGTNSYQQALEDYISNLETKGTIDGVFNINNLKPGSQTRYNKALKEIQNYYSNTAGILGVTPDKVRNILKSAKTQGITTAAAAAQQAAIDKQGRESAPGRGDAGNPGGSSGAMTDDNAGTFCFDPNTLVQMADGSEKKIKEIQLGDQTKGGEVTGVFQFKASDEIHDYKGVVVAGSHYVKENGKFIMVQDSPISVKIDKIPVVYSLDTTGRRIFINNIEFADYNGDGVAKNFLTNAGVDLTGFDTEVLRQVENRLL